MKYLGVWPEKLCMPFSSVNKRTFSEDDKNGVTSYNKRNRVESSLSIPYNMNIQQKKANFASLSGNGLRNHSGPLVASKPGTSKKLVIKNFRGIAIYVF